MCTFITAILPADADRDVVESRLHGHRRQLRPYLNEALQKQLLPGERFALSTWAHCDCGTPLGNADIGPRRRTPVEADAIQAGRMRRKGWSEAKISRALTQRGDASERDVLAQKAHAASGESQGTLNAEAWLDCLRDVLESGATPWIGLLHHFYSGGLDQEFVLQARENWCLAALDADALARMREDKLHVIGYR